MTPHPIYTFLVNSIDYQMIYSQPLPSDINNVVMGLNSQSVYVPYLNKPLKNGDIFTLYGKRAQTVYEMFIGKSPRILELVATTDVLPSLITNKFEIDPQTLPITSCLSNYYKASIINYSGRSCSFLVSFFDANRNSVDAQMTRNGVLESFLSSSFLITLENKNHTEIIISAENKFYFTYTGLVFE